jgi:hypothetical protein
MDEKTCNPSRSGRKLITHNICPDDIHKKEKGAGGYLRIMNHKRRMNQKLKNL